MKDPIDYIKRLQNLDDKKLMDVVKNYRQYGYDEDMRNAAIGILNERGITKKELQLTGNFENKNYDRSLKLYRSFSRNSNIAFIFYILFLIFKIIGVVITLYFRIPDISLFDFSGIFLLGFIIFIFKSFLNQYQFYKSINKDYGAEGVLLYLFLGMPFYLFMYFFFKNQMKEKLKEIT